MMAGIDQRLLEKSRYGMIPVVADGLKPFTVYAAEADRAKAAKMPVVAIVVGGLGVGAAKTTDAIMKLPAAVTLAFTPYGSDPGKLAERARAQRHEILLQIPMEPFDYPDNDPGPADPADDAWRRTESRPAVLASQPLPGLCRDRQFHGRALRRHRCGRCSRSSARPPSAGSAISTTARRRAASPPRWRRARRCRSPRPMSPSMRCPTAAEIDRALAKLESLAKERGTAVGIASALPISIERIGAWTKDARKPWHHACAIDNRDAEIKIQLKFNRSREFGTSVSRLPCLDRGEALTEWRATKTCPIGHASA